MSSHIIFLGEKLQRPIDAVPSTSPCDEPCTSKSVVQHNAQTTAVIDAPDLAVPQISVYCILKIAHKIADKLGYYIGAILVASAPDVSACTTHMHTSQAKATSLSHNYQCDNTHAAACPFSNLHRDLYPIAMLAAAPQALTMSALMPSAFARCWVLVHPFCSSTRCPLGGVLSC